MMAEASISWRRFITRVSSSILPFKVSIAVILFIALLGSGLGVMEPLIFKYLVDGVVLPGSDILRIVFVAVMALVLLSLARELLNFVQSILVWKVRIKLQLNLQAAAVEKLFFLPLSYHQQEGVGAIMTKLDRAINGFVGAFSEIAFSVLPSFVYLLASLFVMLRLNWQLSLLVLFFAPIPAIIGVWASKEQTERDKFLMEAWSKIYGRFYEAFSCILTVKSYAMEKAEIASFITKVTDTNRYVMKGIKTDSKIWAYKNISITIARAAAIAFGGYMIVDGKMTIGTLLAFLGYIGNLFGPVQGLTNVYQTYRRATVSLEILNSLLDTEDPVADLPAARDLDKISGEIRFENLSFGYHQEKPVFKNINLHVRAGEAIALVGPSGVGKTTLMSLLLRLYSPSGGSIIIDGTDIRQLKQSCLRRHIGIVLQDSLLFNDTIKNNILYGTLDASQDRIERAARLANAHDFIMQLPMQYDTVVGEKGNNLSGGQKQRVAIARAILKNPTILILDEATSALDANTDALVQEAFKQLVKGRTTFIISHKMANIVDADRVVFLRNGQIESTVVPQEVRVEEKLYATPNYC
jgi:ATP-binding cassette subfamily B protein